MNRPALYKYSIIQRVILVSVMVLFANTAFSQRIPGIVLVDKKPVIGATIRDLNAKFSVISDKDGKFAAKFKEGDSILTSYVGSKTDTTIFKGQPSLAIRLEPESNVLKQVVIKDHKLSPLEKLKNKQEEYRQIYRKGNDRILTSVGFGFAVSIDGIYSALSKEGKDARRLQKVFVKDYESSVVDSRFTKSLVAETTGYQGKQLDTFYFDTRPDYQFIKSASDYDIIQYIQKKAKEYIFPKDSAAVNAVASPAKQ
ncbi:hypothetical protein [Mucilaginibacter myungsuensis]|uniref:Carboxypeptidase-like protein n=1 Tax=Mucilaginibacter myungsuensis TaxID=649104 RepID=A0A929KTR3_9SPHI|nr:hypothetical protein [Mucilaginibacter myungsuensis]MBE9660253.1 hypothetical protein [Mucilaginibacter myungsuensis]MDN3600295.1 hypothetical protein [Mucilaginibacter myungsuensis]